MNILPTYIDTSSYLGTLNKSKCLNIIDNDFINETASNISPEKLSDDEKNEIVKKSNSNSNKKPP